MRGLKIWKRLVLRTTLRGRICSQLFEQHQIAMFASQLSDKIPIHRPNMQQDGHLLFHPHLLQNNFPPPSTSSSKNTSPTSDTLFHVVVISADGQHKECFFGTRSQLVSQVDLFLTTGKSIPSSPKKSFNVCLNEVWCLHFSGQLRDDI